MAVTFRLGVRTPEQSTPATPAAGYRLLYPKSTGWYDLDSAGTERLLTHAIEAYPFSVSGALTVRTGVSRLYLDGSYTFESCRASVGTAPTGAAVIVDVKKNGVTIYTTQSARPTIAVSTFTAVGNSPALNTFVAGDYVTVDIAQIGSTVAGSDLVVTLRLRKTS